MECCGSYRRVLLVYLDMFGALYDVFGENNVTWAIVWLISVAAAYKMGKGHHERR